jgi:cyclopropane-fatty-acyl-phospholipid synthase
MLLTTSKTKIQNSIQEILELGDIEINGNRPWDIQVYNENLYQRIIRCGAMGLGESYMDGWWDCSRLDDFFTKILRAKLHKHKINTNFVTLVELIKASLWNLQSSSRSFQVGEHHYDLGNELYQAMLDSKMTYSCGYWKNATNLDEAQEAKLDLICKKLQLEKGMTLLDIGCGWGSLMKYASEKYGVSCVGLTVSKEQIKLGEQLCEGLPVKFLFKDYRVFQGEFDRISSIGMFEHVGYKNYHTFMKTVRNCLANNGLFLLQTIGNSETEHYRDAWINKYIFPNGMIPSAVDIASATEGLFIIEDWHNFGQDYDLTLMAWLKNFDKNWIRLSSIYNNRFYKMWKYYLCSTAGSFRARNIHLWQIVFSKQGILGGYQSVR